MFTAPQHLQALASATEQLRSAYDRLPRLESPGWTNAHADVLSEVAQRLGTISPFGHPFYLGQMLKPPHPLAQLAYSLAMNVNPNNHARDGGAATSDMEVECVDQLANMIGWTEHLGHLTGGGTLANFEALWVGRELHPGRTLLASEQAHYTHGRLSRVLNIPFQPVRVDAAGRMDVNHLAELLQQHDVGMVVATTGTTGLGAVDPLHEIAQLKSQHGFRLHVDAAYGGYFRLASNLQAPARAAFDAYPAADSLVIDPHKHGLQPYGCGCVLFRDRRVAALYQHQSPYTYFTPADLHLGEISLECSRPGSAAAALWATLRALPLLPGGEFAQGLEQGRAAALQLQQWIGSQQEFAPVTDPELDIVVWAVRGKSASESSRRAQAFFDIAAKQDIHLALINLSREFLASRGVITDWDAEQVTCLRACLMKPIHLEWMPQILERLQRALSQCPA